MCILHQQIMAVFENMEDTYPKHKECHGFFIFFPRKMMKIFAVGLPQHQALALLEMAAKEEAKPAKQGRNDWVFCWEMETVSTKNLMKNWDLTNKNCDSTIKNCYLTNSSFNRPKLANRRGKWGHHWFISLEIAAPINKNRDISSQNVAGNLGHKQTIPKKSTNIGIAANIIKD